VTSERIRVVRRAVGFVIFGVVVYLAALTFCFPYDRAREMAVALGARGGYDVEIAHAGAAFPFGIKFDDIRVRSRSAAAGAKPAQARFDFARLALLPLVLSNGRAFDVQLSGLGGSVELTADAAKKGPFHYDLVAHNINMAQLPGARELFNLPLGGTLEATIHLDSASGNFADTKGEISIKCAACVVGDGKTPIKLGGGNAFLAAGLTLPRVRLGDLTGKATILKGLAKLQGVQAKSPDAELTLEGDIALRDPLAYSTLNGYLRFKLGDALLKSSPTIASILQMAAAPGHRPDGFYGLHLAGTFAAPTTIFSATAPAGTAGAAAARPAGRPSIMPVMAAPSPPRANPPPPPPPAPASPAPQSPPPPPVETPPPPVPAVVPPPPVAPVPPVTEVPTAAPPMRGTVVGGTLAEATRGMLRGMGGGNGVPLNPSNAGGTSGAPPPPADGAPAAPPGPPPGSPAAPEPGSNTEDQLVQ
jgi:type II secretion system protein N